MGGSGAAERPQGAPLRQDDMDQIFYHYIDLFIAVLKYNSNNNTSHDNFWLIIPKINTLNHSSKVQKYLLDLLVSKCQRDVFNA